MNGLIGETVTPEADRVQPERFRRHPLDLDVRRNVLVNAGTSTHERILADPDELMQGGQAADDGVPSDLYVPCEGGLIRQDHALLQLAVVRHMDIGHEVAIATDGGDSMSARAR